MSGNRRRLLKPIATSRLPKPKISIMLPGAASIWQRDSQANACSRPGAVRFVQNSCSADEQGEHHAWLWRAEG